MPSLSLWPCSYLELILCHAFLYLNIYDCHHWSFLQGWYVSCSSLRYLELQYYIEIFIFLKLNCFIMTLSPPWTLRTKAKKVYSWHLHAWIDIFHDVAVCAILYFNFLEGSVIKRFLCEWFRSTPNSITAHLNLVEFQLRYLLARTVIDSTWRFSI